MYGGEPNPTKTKEIFFALLCLAKEMGTQAYDQDYTPEKLPCVMWLAIYKPKKLSLSWICNWSCIVLGVILMIVAPIGGLRSIIVQAKDYEFFS